MNISKDNNKVKFVYIFIQLFFLFLFLLEERAEM